MATVNGMFLFEVVVENVNCMVNTKCLIIRSEFSDILSLELKDPKQMHIVMPEPLPLPPEPPGKKKKGKKKAKPKKPKGKKGKKGKKGVVELPPPEPAIQSGQSVLFSSSAEVLIENMKKFPLDISLWNKEDNATFIGSTRIPWDPVFIKYLEKIANCEEPPAVTVKDDYNVFEEGKAKIMAKIGIQVKLSYLKDKVTTSFRTLSEDLTAKKYLYTGINDRKTSYICTMKTTDEVFEENCNKIENSFIVDKPKPKAPAKIVYADYKNAPAANLSGLDKIETCCLNHADQPPESKYKSPETCPDIDFIIDYVRKIIVSCNDNMRMLTPHPTIRPRIKATDIDRLCYCKETDWPPGKFAERFRKEVQSGPCPLCINAGKRPEGIIGATFDIANIRGPCGKHDCRIARDLRAYIQNLVEEDNVEFTINDIIGPCGSKDCTVAEKILQFLRHEGIFSHGATDEGLSTQCACLEKMKKALIKKESCASICSKTCEDSDSDVEGCEGKGCPYKSPETTVYDVYYFTVEYDYDKSSPPKTPSEKGSDSGRSEKSAKSSSKSKFKYCAPDCPISLASDKSCSKVACSVDSSKKGGKPDDDKCEEPTCPIKHDYPPSPADSNIEIDFEEITNPCCIKSCDIAERVKEFIAEGVTKKSKCNVGEEDPCYCDCVCTFKFSSKTTYCAVCGGYECLGDDMKDQPEFMKPHPCPVYHKLYDKKYIQVQSPWTHEEPPELNKEPPTAKSSKGGSKTDKADRASDRRLTSTRSIRGMSEKKTTEKKVENKEAEEKVKKTKQKNEKKKVGKFTANGPAQSVEKKVHCPIPIRQLVPAHMGWDWKATDVPGMKVRPKWKPGAANKILVRKYRTVREGMDSMNKKKRAMMQRKKKIEMKPTLIVTKRDGEYTVQMEVFKKYSKERLLFQYPYDEKPPLFYTIGKTEEEKRKRQRQKDRRERRETRRKSRLLQSTFRDRCQEICLKAYNQAIGLLPLPNPNDPECPCNTHPDPSKEPPIIDSCSCSDAGTISTSDTDNDEWVIEFTPPAARWDAQAKHPPNLTESEAQYSYLDYKVKLLDKAGNPVPRYFKGPDGKQECSDLGGFWGPNKHWLEINKDGYIGPDNRWVPMNFVGPDGVAYSSEDGTFTDSNGQLWKIGIDGYVDKNGKWQSYGRKRPAKSTRSTASAATTPEKKEDVRKFDSKRKSETSAPVQKGKTGGPAAPPPTISQPDKRKSVTVAVPAAHGKNAPNFKRQTSTMNRKNPLIMNVAVEYDREKRRYGALTAKRNKQRMDAKKLSRYQEIIKELESYEDLGDLRIASTKTNRASNTIRKNFSKFTIQDGVGSGSYENKTRSRIPSVVQMSGNSSRARSFIAIHSDSVARSTNTKNTSVSTAGI